MLYAGWENYHISNVMQYTNTALKTTSLVMYGSKSFSFFLWLWELHKHLVHIKIKLMHIGPIVVVRARCIQLIT